MAPGSALYVNRRHHSTALTPAATSTDVPSAIIYKPALPSLCSNSHRLILNSDSRVSKSGEFVLGHLKNMVRSLSAKIRDAAHRLPAIEDKAFGSSFDAFGNHRVVLIGDARYYHPLIVTFQFPSHLTPHPTPDRSCTSTATPTAEKGQTDT